MNAQERALKAAEKIEESLWEWIDWDGFVTEGPELSTRIAKVIEEEFGASSLPQALGITVQDALDFIKANTFPIKPDGLHNTAELMVAFSKSVQRQPGTIVDGLKEAALLQCTGCAQNWTMVRGDLSHKIPESMRSGIYHGALYYPCKSRKIWARIKEVKASLPQATPQPESIFCFECDDKNRCASNETCSAMHQGYPRRTCAPKG